MSKEQERKPVPATAIATDSALDLESVFHQHATMVYRAAFRVTGNHQDAEDVLQTVFLRLLRRTASMENPESYLRRAAVNSAIDLVRSRAAQMVPLEEAAHRQTEFLAPDRASSSAELRAWLRRAIARLHPTAAQMFVLRFFEDKENPEIARMLGTTPGSVAVTLHRTRERIQQELRKYLGEES
ncbi:MAG: RNA polymerase sigma factor [Bryobacteraceae bacterium]